MAVGFLLPIQLIGKLTISQQLLSFSKSLTSRRFWVLTVSRSYLLINPSFMYLQLGFLNYFASLFSFVVRRCYSSVFNQHRFFINLIFHFSCTSVFTATISMLSIYPRSFLFCLIRHRRAERIRMIQKQQKYYFLLKSATFIMSYYFYLII